MPGRITLPEYLLRPNALNPYSTVDPFLDRLPRLGKLGLLDQAGDDYALAPLGRDLLTSPVTDGVDHYRSIALESGHQPCYLARSVLRETRSLACCILTPCPLPRWRILYWRAAVRVPCSQGAVVSSTAL